MNSTRSAVDIPDTRAELQALFRLAHTHDQARGERYGARPATDRSD